MMDKCETNPRMDSFLKQLTDSQRQAVCHVEGPLLILAGPGSGKTRVITYRIAELIRVGVRPWNICAITFTNKAADEMRQRALAQGASSSVQISTFHSLCVRILRQYSDNAQLGSNFSIYDSKEQARCVRQAISDCDLDTSNFAPARMHSAISTLKNNMEDVDTYETEAIGFFPKALAKIYRQYQTILKENNALDFDDLLMSTALMLRNDADVRAQLSDRFKYLLVDEYQDTNSAQYEIAKYIAMSHGNICVTGDPDQSIYRWRGADIRNILLFEKDWPNAKVIKLQENFRSTPNILKIADKLIVHNSKRKEKRLIPTRNAGDEVHVDAYEDETAEAMGVAEKINQLVAKGCQLRDIAIFYRVNSMSRVLEEAFIQNQLPYQIVRGVEFYGRQEIRDVLGYLKILVNPSDEVSLTRIINTPTRGIGKTTIDHVTDYARA
ncbi:MAG TPA: UvrD-helicase domain-containing protein, partial [Sedimentisphaerales bacterium]|nr:UvrD-helicase domain-containing protein [Sedimentisphaerales bacterium]